MWFIQLVVVVHKSLHIYSEFFLKTFCLVKKHLCTWAIPTSIIYWHWKSKEKENANERKWSVCAPAAHYTLL